MATLKFSTAEVRKLVDHAKAAKEHSANFEHLLDKQFAKEGAVPNAHGLYRSEDMDLTKIPAALDFVKDAGIYVMSNGLPSLPGTSTRNYVVYAETYGADADYDHIRRAAGGDDFAEALPLHLFEEPLAQAEKLGKSFVCIQLTTKHIRVTY
ncbi:MAG: DUF3085 domain-containing protein [Rhodocyclaceae bacterium]|nr:DUF3085 domain-containing protein [Rhodocyclaceae bacterium]